MATDTRSSGMICSGQLHRLTFKLHDVQGIIKCCVYFLSPNHSIKVLKGCYDNINDEQMTLVTIMMMTV